MRPINELFSNPRKAEYAAKAGLAKTELGRTGAARLKVDEATGKITYVSSITGQEFDTAGEAFLDAKKFLLTDYAELRYGASKAGSEFYDTRFSQAGAVLESFQDKLLNLTADQKASLERIGLGGMDPNSLLMEILTTKSEGSKGATLAAKELEKLGKGFIPIVDGEGGAFLTMKALVGGEERSLTSAQMHMMASIVGSGFLNAEKLQSALGEAAMPGFVNKLPKRLRAFFSERDVLISATDIGNAVGLGELRVDSGIDYLKNYFELSTREASSTGFSFLTTVEGKTYNLIDELLNKDLVKATIDNLATGEVDKQILQSEELIDLVSKSTSSKDLLERAKSILDDEQYKSLQKIVSGVKKEFDGISPINSKLRDYKMQTLQNNIQTIRDQIKEIHSDLRLGITGRTRQDAELLEQQLYELQRQYDVVANADNLYQVTLRGGIGEEQIKSAANFTDFDLLGQSRKGLFSNFAAILDEEAIKSELGFNFKGLVISGFGSSSDRVYADPVSSAFLGELFSSDYDLENIKRYSAEIMQDFNDAVNQNILPPRIKEFLHRTVFNDELDYLPEYMTETRIRNKEFARQILEMHQSGISPKDSPRMLNMLSSLHASEMYRIQTKGDVATYLPVLPDVRRFAVSTEGAGFQGGTAITDNLTGFTNVDMKGVGKNISTQLLEFRVNDNRLLFGPGMTDRFFHSLGGFDLDDKVLTKMMTYKDNSNKKRLLFGIYRQPSGPEESIYAKANLDEGTLRSYFQNERFRGLLEDFRSSVGGSRATSLDELHSVLWEDSKYKKINAQEAEQLVIDVYDFAESRGKAGLRLLDGSLEGTAGAHNRRILRAIQRQGSSSLANSEQYTKPGIFKMFVDEKAFNTEQGFLIKQELQKLIETKAYKNQLDVSVYNSLKTALENNQFQTVNNIFASNIDNPIFSAMKEEAVFKKMFNVATSQEASLLGTYVNRTMLVGSKLNQTQDLIEELIDMGGQEGRIRRILEHQIGLVSQEVAIDFSKSASGVMPQLLDDIDIIRESFGTLVSSIESSTDINAAIRAAQKIGGGASINEIGAQAIQNLGRRIGAEYAQVIELATEMAVTDAASAEKFKERFLPKLDQQLLKGRAQIVDIESIMKGISEGIAGAATDSSIFAEIIGQLSEEKMPATSEQRRDLLIRLFGANEQHVYSSVARLHGVGTITAANLEAQNNIRRRSRIIDPSLASLEYTEDSRRAADFLLQKHNDEASRIINFSADIKELNNEAVYELFQRKLAMGDRVTDEIREAARASNVSVEEMINILKKRSNQLGLDFLYEDLNYFPESVLQDEGGFSQNLRQMMNAADVKRKANYARNIIESDDVQKTIGILGDATTENITLKAKQAAQEMLDVSRYGLLHNPASPQLDLLALLSDDRDILNYVFMNRDINKIRAGLSNKLDAILANSRYKELGLEFFDPAFTERLAPSAAEPTTKIAEELRRVISGEEVPVAKASFKRFSEFVKDGSLKTLFQENKLFKNSVIAAGALVVGSFIYEGVKDRSQEDIQGPPLLPGGSAYEDDYPKRLAEIPQIGRMAYNSNIDYKVNLYGNIKDVSNFREQAMGLGKFNMNTTMYRRSPQAGKDPYAEIASSF